MPTQPNGVRSGQPVRADYMNIMRRLLADLLFVGPGLRKRSTGSAVLIELSGKSTVGTGVLSGRPFYPINEEGDWPTEDGSISINAWARVNYGAYAGTEYSREPNNTGWIPVNRIVVW